MTEITWRAEEAYDYPLLIKNLLFAPAAYHPEQEIVYRGEHRFTYAQFRERVRKLAAALIDLGVKPGDTVAVMDWDSHRYLECFYAVPMIGAVLHTINIRLTPEQMIYTISHAEDSVLLINSEFLPLLSHIKNRVDTIRHYILLADAATENLPVDFTGEYETLLAAATPLQDFPDLDERTRATTFYTTGTTGMPKGVYFSHRQLVLHTLSGLVSLASNPAQGSFQREDVYMPLTPMFHVHAWGIPYMATMLGVKQVYPGKYVPEHLLRLIEQEKVTYSHCVPTILHMLLKHPASEKTDFSRWKVIIGGAALPKSLCAAALQKGIDVYSGYGMSETCPILTISQLNAAEMETLTPEEQISMRCRTGVPFSLVHLQVTDDKMQPVRRDDRSAGEILVRAPWLTQGYLKDQSNSKKLWSGGWLHTSDVACWNEQGSVRITDRLRDAIKVGGEWLSSLEMEDVLTSHPAVSEAALIGQSHERWGEIPYAFVVVKEGQKVTAAELTRHMRGYIDKGLLSKEAVLMKVKFVTALEKTSVGKTDKMAMRAKYAL